MPPPENEIHFTTLGMFIIDQIHYGPPSDRRVVDDVVGGAGTYALLGARLFSPPPLSKTLGWIVDCGRDFPPALLPLLRSFDTTMQLRHDAARLTTRGWNSYGPGELRGFRYLTPKKRLDVGDLREYGLHTAKSAHLICSPQRARGLVRELKGLRVWEPVPDLCTLQYREEMLSVLKEVDVISPNEDELAGFFGESAGGWEHAERLVQVLLEQGVGAEGSGAVVVRMGRRGCLVATREGSWRLPAFYGPDPGEDGDGDARGEVVDPTGGGNTFVGALAVGLARGRSVVYAAAMGNVAASFAIEQMGLPTLSQEQQGERWNGVSVEERMRGYVERLRNLGIDIPA
ncbi:Ribokinase-like protein [Sphaerosporella brunnea]|uniref:Ribokinase-like protein n=1 Tax=Sphaerosporella brunnea TaxID=1250544 RepID=A0A5J5EK07_9PEZI|nr:Ribokinase-like protein [Sphaerosporella brunnea]